MVRRRQSAPSPLFLHPSINNLLRVSGTIPPSTIAVDRIMFTIPSRPPPSHVEPVRINKSNVGGIICLKLPSLEGLCSTWERGSESSTSSQDK